MPSKSKAQAKAMRAACNDRDTRKGIGISKKDACEWAKADQKQAAKKKGSK